VALPEQTTRFYEFGPFRMNSVERTLLRDGEMVPLTPKQFDILLVLVESRGHVVEKERLMQEIWPDTAVEEGNLTTNISMLRKALEESANGQRYIQTLQRRGYRFVAQVIEVSDEGTSLIVQEHIQSRVIIEQEEAGERPNALTDSRWVKRSPMWKLGLVAGVLLIVSGAFVLFWIWNKPKPPASDGSVKRIAVLPFKPVAPDSRNESLELGMADTLINKLSGIRQLIVWPMSDVRNYAGLEQNPLAAGRELGVDYVLEGNLQMVGEQTRATVRLLRVKDGSAVWTDKCDQACSKLFELQDAIAERIAAALALELTGEEKKQLAKHYTDNTEAYRLYSMGMYYLRARPGVPRSSGVPNEEMLKSLDYFEQAIRIDSNYALAYKGLCDAYYTLLSRGIGSPKEAQQKYEWAALMAVELDDTLSEAHAQLAYVKKYNWDWAAAEREHKRSLELNPNSAEACQAYTYFLVDVGRLDEALVIAERAEKLYEVNPRPLVAYVYFHKHEYDKAIALFLANPPNQRFLVAQAYLAKGMNKEAIAQMQKVVANENAPVRWSAHPMLAYTYAMAGNRDAAVRILGEQKELAKQRYISPFNFAIIYLGLGDKDRAFEYLDKAYKEHPQTLVHLKSQPMFDSLRSDPRYTELLRKMNLA
jgi:DNA-binding winged helix-turn-helix (wHTH) protein/TolB-like protein/Tfp pilus assembly protein PilF